MSLHLLLIPGMRRCEASAVGLTAWRPITRRLQLSPFFQILASTNGNSKMYPSCDFTARFCLCSSGGDFDLIKCHEDFPLSNARSPPTTQSVQANAGLEGRPFTPECLPR
jgi:hypothetical protein